MLLAVDTRELVLVRAVALSEMLRGSTTAGSGNAHGRPLVGEGALGCDAWPYGYRAEPTIGGAVRMGPWLPRESDEWWFPSGR